MSLPLLHAGRTNPGLSAALDLRFALDKSLTAYRGPTPSFSRASTGSYFDGSGVLRYANVNIQPYSEQFSSWAFENSSVSSDVAVAPDGKTTADKVYETSATGEHNRNYNNTAAVGTYTLSFYIKPAGRNWAAIYIYHPSIGRGHRAWFDVQNGVVGTTAAIGAGLTGVSSGMVSAGNGWYRCWLTATTAATDLYSYIGLAQSNGGATNYAGDGSSGSYVWGAQLEASSTVGTYCPTTNAANSAPRFNHTYNGTSWVSRGLLVEDQRTNSRKYSEEVSYLGFANGGYTSNAYTAPDGTNTADSIYANTGNYNHAAFDDAYSGDGTTWTLSCFVKYNGVQYFSVGIYSNSTHNNVLFDIVNGTYTGTSDGSPSGYGITNVGNGWFRVWVSVPTIAGYTAIFFGLSANGSTILAPWVGDNVSGVQLWGMQIEKSANFPTSYIKNTTSGSATRSADVCQITGSDFSGFWNGTEGTLVAEYDRIGINNATESEVFQATNSSGTHQFYLNGASGNDYFLYYPGSVVANLTLGPVQSAGISVKASTAYKVNDFAGSRNGGAVVTDSSGAVPVVDRLSLGRDTALGLFYLNGHIARLRYFNKRLPNSTLQQLSDPDPTLNLQFALNKTLTPVAGPAPSFSRASTGTYFNASGVLTSASINTPRFDHVYSGGQWVSKGLLLEEQRTNSLSYSEDFTVWAESGNGQINSNVATAPDGTTTADEIQVNSGAASAYERYRAFTYSSVPYSISIFVKYVNNRWVSFGTNNIYHNKFVFFDILNGVVGTASPFHSGEIINCGNGWFRLIVKFVGNTGTSNWIDFTLADGDGVNSCTTGAKVLVWGAQIEAGAFPTSYIGTTSSSVVRSADVCQITGTSFNWMWNQGEGIVAVEFDRLFNQTSGEKNAVWFAQNSASPGSITMGQELYNGSEYFLSQADVAFSATPPAAGITGKSATGYKVNDYGFSLNGASALTDTVCTVPTTVDRLVLGNQGGYSVYLNGHIAKLIYYPARLTNTKLQQLST